MRKEDKELVIDLGALYSLAKNSANNKIPCVVAGKISKPKYSEKAMYNLTLES